MRKTMIYVCTAALVFASALPTTVMAATTVYGAAGIGQKIMIGGNCTQDRLPNIKIQEGNLAGIMRAGSECSIPAIIGDSGQACPGQLLPGQSGSGQITPGQNGSGQVTPGQSGSNQIAPGQNGSGQVTPGQSNSNQVKPEQPDQDTGAADADDIVKQIAELVNQERAKAGLPSLQWSTAASDAAQIRAKELAVSFSHSRPDGSSFATALTQAGIRYSSSGENIAYGQTSAEQVMNQWMNSSGHRANILSADYSSIGVGHYVSSSGVHYWTQLFFK